MNLLVIAELEGGKLRAGTLSAIAFARSVADSTNGQVTVAVLGHQIGAAVEQAANYANVIAANHADLADVLPGPYAAVIASIVNEHNLDAVAAASTAQAKDVIGRAAGLLGGYMASDVVAHRIHDGQLEMDRPILAGAAVATVVLEGGPQVITIRPSAYLAATEQPSPGEICEFSLDAAALPADARIEQIHSKTSTRPDVTEASVVVSGGRALKNSDDFERLVGGLADALGGAAGSSRALVDAGITPNELQVGQTGKVVAPEVYIALGLSGAVQHLAGMKKSKTIVAINNDPDAPIFDVADYGLVADVYEAAPELIAALRARGSVPA